jgi:hypothetical protein
MAEQAKDWGLYGLYGEAIAVHPYSEKGFLHLGAKETGSSATQACPSP